MADKLTRKQIQNIGRTQARMELKNKKKVGSVPKNATSITFPSENRAYAKRAQRLNKGR